MLKLSRPATVSHLAMGTVCNSYKIRGRKLKTEGWAGVIFDRNHTMKIALLAALAAFTAAAPATMQNADWGLYYDDPVAAPEPASPVVMLALAGAALILRRNGGAK
jgi:hypothetical protein